MNRYVRWFLWAGFYVVLVIGFEEPPENVTEWHRWVILTIVISTMFVVWMIAPPKQPAVAAGDSEKAEDPESRDRPTLRAICPHAHLRNLTRDEFIKAVTMVAMFQQDDSFDLATNPATSNYFAMAFVREWTPAESYRQYVSDCACHSRRE